MQAELVQVTTQDGIALDGAVFPAAEVDSETRALDAVLLVHGSSGNFYTKLNQTVAQRLGQAGYPSVSFNTRSHDLVWGTPGNFMGNAYDILDQCRLDLKASIDWLANRGYGRIGIFGHSMGAVKVVYYQATEQDDRVGAVISSSPVRLSHSYYLASEGAEEHRQNYQRALELVVKGQPNDLIPVTFPMPHLFSAGAYLDKHGPEERYNLMKYVADVAAPLLIMAGSKEDHPRLRDCATDMYDLVRDEGNARLMIQQGADHAYTGMLDHLASNVVTWLASLEGAGIRTAAAD